MIYAQRVSLFNKTQSLVLSAPATSWHVYSVPLPLEKKVLGAVQYLIDNRVAPQAYELRSRKKTSPKEQLHLPISVYLLSKAP